MKNLPLGQCSPSIPLHPISPFLYSNKPGHHRGRVPVRKLPLQTSTKQACGHTSRLLEQVAMLGTAVGILFME